MSKTHQDYLDELVDEIEDDYVTVETEVLYKRDWKHDGGDLDVMAIDEDWNFDIYEVKSGSGKSVEEHAMDQLERAYHHYEDYFDSIHCYLKMAENDIEEVDIDE